MVIRITLSGGGFVELSKPADYTQMVIVKTGERIDLHLDADENNALRDALLNIL